MALQFDPQSIQEMKQKLDVDLIGVARFDDSAPKELIESAQKLLLGTKSVVVFGKEVYGEIVDLLGPSKEEGTAEPGALIKPHAAYLYGRLTRAVYDTAKILREEGYRTLPLPPTNTPTDQRSLVAIFSYKHAAVAAGLGVMGRHSMLITREFGPRVRLGCLLTQAPLEPTPVPEEKYCKDCGACITACPSGALQKAPEGELYAINKFACRTYRSTGLACSMCLKTCSKVQDRA